MDPGFITTPDADDTWGDWKNNQSDAHHPDDRRPRSPQGPPSNTSATAPLGSVSYRVATGDSDASDPEESFSIAAYEPGDTDIEEMKKQQQLTPTGSAVSLSWAVLMYISYHKTSWESVAKILVENCVRPASWTKNEAGIPTQFPCYGFFGYSFEIADTDALQSWAIRVCTSNLYKIGKGQNPSGILAICRSPKLVTQMHPGPIGWKRPNSTPLCYCWHIARGKDGATAMNSKCASVSYVASTHSVYLQLITKAPIPARASTTSVAGDPPEPSRTEPQMLSTLLPPLHQRHRTQHHNITPGTPPPAMNHATPRNLIAEDIIETLLPLGIELHRVTMAAIPLIAKDVPVTTTVKDPRDTSLLDEMPTDRAGDPCIKEKH